MNDTPQWTKRQRDFFEELPSAASNPAHLRWSDEKLRELRPELFGISGILYSLFVLLGKQFNDKQFIKECIDGGDSRAAVVLSVSPLLVAAYSDELDAVAMLRFPDHFVQSYSLAIGSRLLTVNSYGAESSAADLVFGPHSTGTWDNMIPTIAEFASDDFVQIDQLKRQIPEAEWQRAFAMGRQYLQALPGVYRDGRPFFAAVPLRDAKEYEANLNRAQRVRMMLAAACGAALLVMLMCGGIGLLAIGRLGFDRNPVPVAARPNMDQPVRIPRGFDRPPGAGFERVVPFFVEQSDIPSNRNDESNFIRPPDGTTPQVPPPIETVASPTGASEPATNRDDPLARFDFPREGSRFPPGGIDGAKGSAESTPSDDDEFSAGDKIEVLRFGQWLPGEVVEMLPGGWVKVQLQSRRGASVMPADRVRRLQGQSENAAPGTDPKAPRAAMRTWTDVTGRFKVEARYVELREGKVGLEKSDGASITLALDKLSPADQQYVKSLSKSIDPLK